MSQTEKIIFFQFPENLMLYLLKKDVSTPENSIFVSLLP